MLMITLSEKITLIWKEKKKKNDRFEREKKRKRPIEFIEFLGNKTLAFTEQ